MLTQDIASDITSILVAMNFTSLGASGPLPLDHIPANRSWVTADISPFATNLVTQVLTCTSSDGDIEDFVRFLLNDGVLPASGANGCGNNKDGLCKVDVFVKAMKERIATVDFEYDCTAD